MNIKCDNCNTHTKRKNYGVVEKSDIVRWLFPNLTSEEISEKIARISNSQIENTNRTIDSILQGQ